jgi:very-short-patch-repair endonuclease
MPRKVGSRRLKKTTTRTISKSAAFWNRLARQEPNNAEMTLFGIMCYLGMPYRYTGNGQFLLMGKCPDFVHLSDRKIIELYGERWHRPEEEQQRIDLFARSDYHVLVVWQKELGPKNRKILYHRLLEFDKLDDIIRPIFRSTCVS